MYPQATFTLAVVVARQTQVVSVVPAFTAVVAVVLARRREIKVRAATLCMAVAVAVAALPLVQSVLEDWLITVVLVGQVRPVPTRVRQGRLRLAAVVGL
jgi:hypothetical protein